MKQNIQENPVKNSIENHYETAISIFGVDMKKMSMKIKKAECDLCGRERKKERNKKRYGAGSMLAALATSGAGSTVAGARCQSQSL